MLKRSSAAKSSAPPGGNSGRVGVRPGMSAAALAKPVITDPPKLVKRKSFAGLDGNRGGCDGNDDSPPKQCKVAKAETLTEGSVATEGSDPSEIAVMELDDTGEPKACLACFRAMNVDRSDVVPGGRCAGLPPTTGACGARIAMGVTG